MLILKKELLNLIKDFIDKCYKNNIWYVADDMTLLYSQKKDILQPFNNKIQVLMTIDSYEKLKRLFPKNVIDNFKDQNYSSLKPTFIKNVKKSLKLTTIVEIRIVVPTTIKKIQTWQSKTRHIWNLLIKKRNNIKNAINDLKTHNYEGYYAITSSFAPFKKGWIYNLSFKTKNVVFNNTKIAIPIEYKNILQYWFNKNY